MKAIYYWAILFTFFCLVSCTNQKESKQKENRIKKTIAELTINPEHDTYQVEMTGYDTAMFFQHYKSRISPPVLNLNQSLEDKSVSNLMLLKGMLYAMKGKIFKNSIYHAYFDTIDWYQPPLWNDSYEISLNDPEKQFISQIDQKISALLINNYSADKMPNPENIANAFQWDELKDNPKLKDHGFVIDFSSYNQPLEIYAQNNRNNVPSFITTDLIMHQMHLFYGVLENEIEEVYLTQKLKSMLEIINVELYSAYEKTLDPKVERAIEENLLYYSIPYAVITGKKTNLIGKYNEQYVEELTKVLQGQGTGSKILGDNRFNYSIFKPHQQYSKNDKIKKYYKALTWLQKINLCLNNEHDFRKALIAAYIIHRSKELQNEYHEFIELKTYFSSQKEQFTLWDLAGVISNIKDIKRFDDLFREDVNNRIKEKLGINHQDDCQLKVSLMPIEYQNLFTDLKEITKKHTTPSSLDLFAALNNPAAQQILNATNPTGSKQEYLASVTENLISISTQEDARSMDWLSTLLTSFNQNIRDQHYMSILPWKIRELNAAMSSWIQLNQRVNLNAIGININPTNNYNNKILKGYVEPNREFWEAAQILLNNTKVFLSDRKMLSGKSNRNLGKLMEMVMFLNEITKKELDGTIINNEEYARINTLGNECHNLSLQLLNPNFNTKHQMIQTSTACATNIFQSGNSENIIGGIGRPGCLLAIVEIDGFLYLTRGAVYVYYELPEIKRKGISQTLWEKKLNDLQPVNWALLLYNLQKSQDI